MSLSDCPHLRRHPGDTKSPRWMPSHYAAQQATARRWTRQPHAVAEGDHEATAPPLCVRHEAKRHDDTPRGVQEAQCWPRGSHRDGPHSTRRWWSVNQLATRKPKSQVSSLARRHSMQRIDVSAACWRVTIPTLGGVQRSLCEPTAPPDYRQWQMVQLCRETMSPPAKADCGDSIDSFPLRWLRSALDIL